MIKKALKFLFLLPSLAFSIENVMPETKEPTYLVTAIYTFWEAYQDSMEIAYLGGSVDQVGNALYPRFYARSGFKVGLGINTEHDNWWARVNYTWFSNNPEMKTNYTVPDIRYHSAYIDHSLYTFSSKFENYFNRIDGSITKDFLIDKSFLFSPLAGILGAFDSQFLNFNCLNFNSDKIYHSRNKQNWWGVGPYGAASISFLFKHYFELVGKAGVALLLSNHKVTFYTDAFEEDGTYDEREQYNYDKFSNVEPMVETYIGVQKCFFWECVEATLSAGWELQTYFDHNGFRGIYPSWENRGSYSMQGLTVAGNIYF